VLGITTVLFLGGVLCSAAAVAALAAADFYERTTTSFESRGGLVGSLAPYGGAQVYDRNGVLLYRFPDPSDGIQIPVSLDEISPHVIAATIATEDGEFWSTPGIDIKSTFAAAWENTLEHGGPFAGRGASGITQQLVKQRILDPEVQSTRSVRRKVTEVLYAIELTRRYAKEDILTWYLNSVNYGGRFDGVESAAQGYFGVRTRDLSLAQSALIAGIPQSPADYFPYSNLDAAKQRQSVVLDLMVRHGDITQMEADEAKREQLAFQPPDQLFALRAPWLVEEVRQQLVARFGEECVRTCGLTVVTTLDSKLQGEAKQILDGNLTRYGDSAGVHNGALVSMDAHTGEILVMLGSRDFDDVSAPIQGQNNFATAILQPGSAFKPFVYLALFIAHGYGPSSTIWDAPFRTADGYQCENPRSIGTLGPIPVALALGSSLNCSANRAAATVGIEDVVKTAQALGITTLGDPSQYGPSIATGGANISLVDMTHAYGTLARDGNMVGADVVPGEANSRALDPVIIRKVTGPDGAVLYEYQPRTEQVVRPGFAYLVTSILSDCQHRRFIWGCAFPAFRLADGRPVAVKTGTQQGLRTRDTAANWQFMYTPDVVTGGWVGNADGATWTDVAGGANAVGFSVQQLEQHIIDTYGIPASDFARPAEVVSVPVSVPDASRGAGCGRIEMALFVAGTQPDAGNRVCGPGGVRIPPEQLGTGGLQ